MGNVDYQETFCPNAKITSIITLIQIVVQNNYVLGQMDFKTAYINVRLVVQRIAWWPAAR